MHGHTILIGDDGWLSHHISISTPLYISYYIFLYSVRITLTLKDGRWMTPIRWCREWQIWAQLVIGYHIDSSRFCHVYNLEDSMVELKHNAQNLETQALLLCSLESSISELPKCFSTWFAIICFYFMSYNAQFHES